MKPWVVGRVPGWAGDGGCCPEPVGEGKKGLDTGFGRANGQKQDGAPWASLSSTSRTLASPQSLG